MRVGQGGKALDIEVGNRVREFALLHVHAPLDVHAPLASGW